MRRLSDKEKEQINHLIDSAQEQCAEISDEYCWMQDETAVKKYFYTLQMHLVIFSVLASNTGLIDEGKTVVTGLSVKTGLSLEETDEISDFYMLGHEIVWELFYCLRCCGWTVHSSDLIDFVCSLEEDEPDIDMDSVADYWNQNQDGIEDAFYSKDLATVYKSFGDFESLEDISVESSMYITLRNKRLGNLLSYVNDNEKEKLLFLSENVCYLLSFQYGYSAPYVSGIDGNGVFLSKYLCLEWLEANPTLEFQFDWSAIWSAVLLADEIYRLEEQYGIPH